MIRRFVSVRRTLSALVAIALAAAIGLVVVDQLRPETRSLTATFSRTTSLYEGARVKVLGVDVGKVDRIEVDGAAVRADIVYDAGVDLPADVHAAIVPPSVVGDRFVQLTPAYVSGPVLKDGAAVGLERTAVPIELDETFRSLEELASALGPNGANRDGALSGLVAATADALRGNGESMNDTITGFSRMIRTLAATSPDIGATVDDLARVSSRLAGNDEDIRRVVTSLAAVSTELNGNGAAITQAITRLRVAMARLGDFTAQHREQLATSVHRISEVSGVLARRTDELDELLKLAPVGLTSLLNSAEQTNYDPSDLAASRPEGRTNSATLRGAFFDDLDVTVAYAVAGICGQIPDPASSSLAPLCALLTDVGGDVGDLLSEAIRKGLGAAGSPGPNSLADLLGGVN